MVNTSAKGRRFEYKIRDLFRSQFPIARSAASKPWDLTLGTEDAVYAIEAKSNIPHSEVPHVYQELKDKLIVNTIGKDGNHIKAPSAFVPLVFYQDNLGRLQMYTRATFKDNNGVIRRPFFDDGELLEVIAISGE